MNIFYRGSQVMMPVMTLVAAGAACGQQCVMTGTEGAADSWPANTSITVYIDPSFSSAKVNAIELAFNYWQSSDTAVNAGVKFTFTSGVVYTPTTANPPPRVYQVLNQNPNGGDLGETSGIKYSNGKGNVSVWTALNTGYTNMTSLTQTMAHEIGHTFGLDDCTNCAARSSVMQSPDTLNDTALGLVGPSYCDQYVALENGDYGD